MTRPEARPAPALIGAGATDGVLGATATAGSIRSLSVRTSRGRRRDRRTRLQRPRASQRRSGSPPAQSRAVRRGTCRRCRCGASRLDRRRHPYARLLHWRLCSPRLSSRLLPTRAALGAGLRQHFDRPAHASARSKRENPLCHGDWTPQCTCRPFSGRVPRSRTALLKSVRGISQFLRWP